ncbi:hypothetical protein EX30DRAFT_306301, partial [Ascodesmis nigricans]
CSLYLEAESLTTRDYQCLVDRGWRRSGKIIYKPHNSLSCCPQYTIRLNANTFKPSRDQRNTIHRWNRFVLGEDYIKEASKKYPKTKEAKKRQKNEFDLAETVHAAEYATLQGHIPPEPSHRFEVTLEPASFSQEKYEVFRNYQIHVHKEDATKVTPASFIRFLCTSPLERSETNSSKKLGSYHQVYRLDGRVFAFGVLDLLPDYVSGVYFAYHSDFEKFNLGKLSACREACLAREGGYAYYGMGMYYISSCPKMRYKSHYGPSELLDPSSNIYNALTPTLQSSLTSHHYFSPSDAAKGVDEDKAWEAVEDPWEGEEGVMKPGWARRSRMPGLMEAEEVEGCVAGVRLRVGKQVVPAWVS